MEGPLENAGVIPRSVANIFRAVDEMRPLGWTFALRVRYIEIYNDTILDLLGRSATPKKLQLRHVQGEVTIPDALQATVSSTNEVAALLRVATQNRTVAATRCNVHLSRSHSVFFMDIVGSNPTTGEERNGGPTLVDLAGSERVS